MGRTERVISILGISAVVICTGATAAYMYINGQSGSKAENNISTILRKSIFNKTEVRKLRL